MGRLRIGLDFDGVIIDVVQSKVECASRYFGAVIPYGQFRRAKVVGSGVMTAADYESLMRLVYLDPKVGLAIPPVKGALDYLPRIIAAGHEVTIITSRDEEMVAIGRKWCRERGLELKFISVGYGDSKEKAAVGFHLYVDDDLHVLKPMSGAVQNLRLFSQAYNADEEVPDFIQRVGSWADLYQLVCRLSAEIR